MIRKHGTDNHFGPGFDAVCAAFPDAVRAHWSDWEWLRPGDSHWLVGVPAQCGGGSGIFWEKVDAQGNVIQRAEA